MQGLALVSQNGIELNILEDIIMTTQSHTQTPDSYDANIIPAETAARIEREGEGYKHVPKDAEGTGGYTVDKEGLVNNYAVEPEMYVETPGDAKENSATLVDTFTIVDTFPIRADAENVVSKIEKVGIGKDKISIIGKGSKDEEHVHGFLNWEDFDKNGGVAMILVGLGIVEEDASRYEAEIEAGKFLVVVTGTNQDVSQTQKILQENGHRVSDRQLSL
jgi:hypothetical protein